MDYQEEARDIVAYAAYCTDKKVLRKSASGGIAAALSAKIINEDGYVAGVTYTEDYLGAEYILTNDLRDIPRIQGSKYLRAKTNDIYSKVKEKLDDDKVVFFTGLPCGIAALKRFLKKDYENLFTCELVCNGPTKTRVHTEYVKYLEEKYNSRISFFSVRYKKYGWPTPYLRAVFENGKVYEVPFYSTEYGYAFRLCGYDSCYRCQFKGDNYVGDLMIGDFWGAGQRDNFWNKDGVSVVLVRTERAHQMLKSVNNIMLTRCSFERAVKRNKRIMLPLNRTPERDKFSKLLDEVGLFSAVEQTMPLKRKMKIKIQKIIPGVLEELFEKLYDYYNTNRNFN